MANWKANTHRGSAAFIRRADYIRGHLNQLMEGKWTIKTLQQRGSTGVDLPNSATRGGLWWRMEETYTCAISVRQMTIFYSSLTYAGFI